MARLAWLIMSWCLAGMGEGQLSADWPSWSIRISQQQDFHLL